MVKVPDIPTFSATGHSCLVYMEEEPQRQNVKQVICPFEYIPTETTKVAYFASGCFGLFPFLSWGFRMQIDTALPKHEYSTLYQNMFNSTAKTNTVGFLISAT